MVVLNWLLWLQAGGGDGETKMEGIGDGGVEGRGDLMKKLDDDMAIHVLQYLDTTRDIANASSVSRSWRRLGPCF